MFLLLRSSLLGCISADAPLVVLTDGTENYQKELQELRVAAQTMVESMGSAEDSGGGLADRLQVVPQKFASTWLRLLGTVWRKLLDFSSHTGLPRR